VMQYIQSWGGSGLVHETRDPPPIRDLCQSLVTDTR
jgi:hypothetical protein